ncbi:MAG: hypothetical protein KME11_04760 [Timaviella obliquedivisa GSE-PSE-MK23-08B]|jgi:hypothetical protein|nr:hypothetical protein [Timaviella obliquedivisa GSE-PSE-MK23-08B]
MTATTKRTQLRVFSLKEVWQSAKTDGAVIQLEFKSYEEAVANLVRWERSLQHLAAMFKFEAIAINTPGYDQIILRPRLVSNVRIDFLPLPPHGSEERLKYLVTARRQIPSELVDVLTEIKNSDRVKAVVCWKEQRQIVMNAACNNIPIGESLDECINWTRHDYWLPEDFSSFEQKCRQENGMVEHTVRTLDPTLRHLHPSNPERWDWISIRNQFRFVNCGEFGLYQIGQNLEYQSISSPL